MMATEETLEKYRDDVVNLFGIIQKYINPGQSTQEVEIIIGYLIATLTAGIDSIEEKAAFLKRVHLHSILIYEYNKKENKEESNKKSTEIKWGTNEEDN